MTYQILSKLKDELQLWKDSVKLREIAYRTLKKDVEKIEEELRKHKKFRNKAYKDWKYARMKVKKLNGSIGSFNSRVREWTKRNPAKALSFLDGKND